MNKYVLSKYIICFMFGLIFVSHSTVSSAAVSQAQNETRLENLTVEKSIEIAFKDNPSLAQMNARYEALKNIPSQKGSLPDPIISFNSMNLPVNSFDTSQENMTQLQIGVSQAFPFPGKLSLKERIADYEAIAACNDIDILSLKLKQQVISSWWELYYLDKSLFTIDKNLDLLRQIVVIVRTKYTVGEGLQQDVLLAQLELSKLLEQKIQVKKLYQKESATLNTLMGQKANNSIILSQSIQKMFFQIGASHLLFEQSKMNHPIFKKQETLLEAAKYRHRLAIKEYYPDFMLGATYGYRHGNNPPKGTGRKRDDFLSMMFSMSVPLYAQTKQSKGVKQRQNEILQEEFFLQDTYNLIYSDIVKNISDYLSVEEQFKLYEHGILPQAKQTVDSMLMGYKVNKVDFLNLVRSQINLFNYEIRYWRLFTGGKQFFSKLEELAAGDIKNE